MESLQQHRMKIAAASTTARYETHLATNADDAPTAVAVSSSLPFLGNETGAAAAVELMAAATSARLKRRPPHHLYRRRERTLESQRPTRLRTFLRQWSERSTAASVPVHRRCRPDEDAKTHATVFLSLPFVRSPLFSSLSCS